MVAALDVPRETIERLERLRDAASRRRMSSQNLVSSASTLEQVWSRHILDSAQLVRSRSEQAGPGWISARAPAFPA